VGRKWPRSAGSGRAGPLGPGIARAGHSAREMPAIPHATIGQGWGDTCAPRHAQAEPAVGSGIRPATRRQEFAVQESPGAWLAGTESQRRARVRPEQRFVSLTRRATARQEFVARCAGPSGAAWATGPLGGRMGDAGNRGPTAVAIRRTRAAGQAPDLWDRLRVQAPKRGGVGDPLDREEIGGGAHVAGLATGDREGLLE
jgi:hypothetical protein